MAWFAMRRIQAYLGRRSSSDLHHIGCDRGRGISLQFGWSGCHIGTRGGFLIAGTG